MKRAILALFLLVQFSGGFAAACPRDTDHDGMPDVWEIKYRTNVSKSDGRRDLDKDGLTNIQEFRIKTDPMNADTDGDGHADGVEVNELKTDPKKAN